MAARTTPEDRLDYYGLIPEEPQLPEKRGIRRKLLWILGAVLIVAVAGVLVARALAGSGEPSVTYAAVERGDITKTISATGKVQALKTVEVGSQASGTIAAIYVDFNDRVRKGQVIARLDSEYTQAQLEQARANLLAAQSGISAAEGSVASADAAVAAAEANVERTRSAMQDARATAERNLQLFNSGVLARQALEQSQAQAAQGAAQYNQAVAQLNQAKSQAVTVRSQLNTARAQRAQAAAAVDLASVNLNRTVITAPVDGVVVARNVDVGQTVAASLQAPTLFVIANDLSRMQVLADVDEADVGQLAPDAKVTFTVDAFPRDTFEGRISQIRLNPQTVQNVVTYTAVIDVANPDLKLRPGMTATVTAVTGEAHNVLRVPNAALRYRPATENGQSQPGGEASGARRAGGRRSGMQVLWKEQPGAKEPVAVRVQTGITDGVYTEIVSGDLHEGDRVATAAPAASRTSTGPQRNFLFGRPGAARRAR